MASEIELKVRQAAGLPVLGAPVAEGSASARDKDAAVSGERGGKAAKGQKSEKHMEA
jgi:hypothetical protein